MPYYMDKCFCAATLNDYEGEKCTNKKCDRRFPTNAPDNVLISVTDMSKRCGEYKPEVATNG